MMRDSTSAYSVQPHHPMQGGLGQITPNDNVDLPCVTRQLKFVVGGNVSVVWADNSQTIEPVVAGERVNWRVRRIRATGTTAIGIYAYC